MRNLLAELRDILGVPALQVGNVASSVDGQVQVELPGGAIVTARGEGTVGGNVYIRNGVVEGPAPDLILYTIDV